LRPDDGFCPNCGKSIQETAVVPTPEADVPVPPLPMTTSGPTDNPDNPDNLVKAFKRASTVKKLLVTATLSGAVIGALVVVTQGGGLLGGIVVAFVLFSAAVLELLGSPDSFDRKLPAADAAGGAGDNRTVLRAGGAHGDAQPIPHAERSRLLDEEVGQFLRDGFFLRQRTPTTAQLVRPKRFSFIWAFLWLLVFGIGIIVYLIYYAAKQDEGRYVEVDEYGAVRATRQVRHVF
jgi:F0F1-type ATP synthase assembly protein I